MLCDSSTTMMSKREERLARPVKQHVAEQAKRAVSLQEIDRGDQARVVRPGVHLQAALPAQFRKTAWNRR
jgi:hypothetical protein